MHPDDTVPDGAVRIPLFNRFGAPMHFALVDAADADALIPYRWVAALRGRHGAGQVYALRWVRVAGKSPTRIYMHREVLGLGTRTLDNETDHINGDGLDNRRCNLRVVTHAQNMQNRPRHRGSASQYRGVWLDKRQMVWRAEVNLNGKRYRLGSFRSEDEAGAVVADWRVEHMPFATER